MKKITLLYIAGFLAVLNIFCWKEVFVLAEPAYLKVDFLDVGQGDSVFIETPEKHQILIDGGPTSAVLEKLAKIMPFFDRSIDLVILTHPESDHMQGAIDVLQRYKIDYVLWTGVSRNTPEFQKWTAAISAGQNATKKITASAKTKITAGKAKIDILYPFENLEGKEVKNTNDSSIVSRLVYGKNSFLFTGDISAKAEKEIAEIASSQAPRNDIKSDVLKVAHHGSKYSTSDLFLENVKPRFAVISVGKNSYGHPTLEALQRLKKYDINVLRTDINGDIKFKTNGNGISNF